MEAREHTIRVALSHLRTARQLLHEARAPKAATAVRHAIKSTDGAARHAAHDETRDAPSRQETRSC